jgi:hypothetical protein
MTVESSLPRSPRQVSYESLDWKLGLVMNMYRGPGDDAANVADVVEYMIKLVFSTTIMYV